MKEVRLPEFLDDKPRNDARETSVSVWHVFAPPPPPPPLSELTSSFALSKLPPLNCRNDKRLPPPFPTCFLLCFNENIGRLVGKVLLSPETLTMVQDRVNSTRTRERGG